MPERMRAAIASVRRISTGGRPDPDRHKPERLGRWVAPDHRALQETFEQVARPGRPRQTARREPPGQAALWQSPDDESPAPVPATRRRGIGIAALAATTVVVLLVGSSLGLPAGWKLELPSLPTWTGAGWKLELPSLPTWTAAAPPEPVAESRRIRGAAPHYRDREGRAGARASGSHRGRPAADGHRRSASAAETRAAIEQRG